MRRLILCFFAAVTLACASTAGAQNLRNPTDREPALSLVVPQGWTAKYDDLGNLQYSNADHALNIQLSIIDAPAIETATLAEVAAWIFQEGGIPPYTRKAAGMIDGRAGEAFFSKKTYPGGGVAAFEVILVKVGKTAVASVGKVTRDGLSAAQLAPLDVIVRGVKIIGARN